MAGRYELAVQLAVWRQRLVMASHRVEDPGDGAPPQFHLVAIGDLGYDLIE